MIYNKNNLIDINIINMALDLINKLKSMECMKELNADIDELAEYLIKNENSVDDDIVLLFKKLEEFYILGGQADIKKQEYEQWLMLLKSAQEEKLEYDHLYLQIELKNTATYRKTMEKIFWSRKIKKQENDIEYYNQMCALSKQELADLIEQKNQSYKQAVKN